MNIKELKVLNYLLSNSFTNQRMLSSVTGFSLGSVNEVISSLKDSGYLDEKMNITDSAKQVANCNRTKRAVILAAGSGVRMAPINLDSPKALLEVNGEPLIERLIKQLNEKEIDEIYVVVGFQKEKFEYLIDKYNVELVVNKDYAVKNNLHSLNLVNKYVSDCYIMPADIWCDKNPFNKSEFYSWYMVNEIVDDDSTVRVNKSMELTVANGGNSMIGISYIKEKDSHNIRKKITDLCNNHLYDNAFWESALYDGKKLCVYASVVNSSDVVEINTYEQLRELDSHSKQLDSDAVNTAAMVLDVSADVITEITALKKGMTNRSFLFSCKGKKYIMRIPGEGTEQLINRKEEADVYNVISDKNLCDNIIYINPDSGYKITEFIDHARCCDAFNKDDVSACMKKLRQFHNMKLKVNHEFKLFDKIEFYESLWEGKESLYSDYKQTKQNVFSLKDYIDKNKCDYILTHIDAVPDNFLITENNGIQDIKLIDWEYASMQDPHVDLAMFCIYAMYDRKHVDELIDSYFTEGCEKEVRIKIYCYIAVCGLLWSNWCEYKSQLGVEFGEYSLRQYRFAKDYYRIVKEELNK